MKTKDFWNAQHYKKHSEGQHTEGVRIVQELPLNGDENILDFGCGDGRTTAEIAKRVSNGFVLGIDISQNIAITGNKETLTIVKNHVN